MAKRGSADYILDEAQILFAERGLAGTSIREIAARCGIQNASLYSHFKSKQDIYEAVLERGLRPIIDLISAAGTVEKPAAWDDRVISQMVSHLEANPQLPKLIAYEVLRADGDMPAVVHEWASEYITSGISLMSQNGRLSGDEWKKSDGPLLVSAWFNLIFGYFAMAPILEVFLGSDPLSKKNIKRHIQMLQKLGHIFPPEHLNES